MAFVKPNITWRDLIRCAFPGCTTSVSAADHCKLCNMFICAPHRKFAPPEANHAADVHWTEPEAK